MRCPCSGGSWPKAVLPVPDAKNEKRPFFQIHWRSVSEYVAPFFQPTDLGDVPVFVEIGPTGGAVPMKRLGKPEEIGELVLFMCLEACECITANTICVNGGGGYR